MIAQLKRNLAIQFKKFLLALAMALAFEPAFLAVDQLCSWVRFGEPSALWEKLLESYLVFYLLCWGLSDFMSLSFHRRLLYGYLLQAVVLKYIYQRFFMERAKVIWVQISNNIEQNQQTLLSSGGYLLAFALTTKALQLYRRTTPTSPPSSSMPKREQLED